MFILGKLNGNAEKFICEHKLTSGGVWREIHSYFDPFHPVDGQQFVWSCFTLAETEFFIKFSDEYASAESQKAKRWYLASETDNEYLSNEFDPCCKSFSVQYGNVAMQFKWYAHN